VGSMICGLGSSSLVWCAFAKLRASLCRKHSLFFLYCCRVYMMMQEKRKPSFFFGSRLRRAHFQIIVMMINIMKTFERHVHLYTNKLDESFPVVYKSVREVRASVVVLTKMPLFFKEKGHCL
jgi:hypothetical protein